MNQVKPFALHITWTCYATWLPGDRRGYVSNTLLPEGGFIPKQNTPGASITADHSITRQRAQTLQSGPAVTLTSEQALCVARSLVEAARQRGWRILRGAVMANHVHVVIVDCPDNGPSVRRILKGNSQAALNKATGCSRRWWTAGGSDRYKHDYNAIEAAVNYVARQSRMLAQIIDMEASAVGEEPPG